MASYRSSAGRLGEHVRDYVWIENRAIYVLGALLVVAPVLTMFVTGARGAWLETISVVVLGPPLGVAMIVTARRRRNDVVSLHQRGLFHRWLGVEHEVAYEDVVSIESDVWQQRLTGLAARFAHHHLVRTRDGAALKITHGFDQVDELVRELRHRTLDARLPDPGGAD